MVTIFHQSSEISFGRWSRCRFGRGPHKAAEQMRVRRAISDIISDSIATACAPVAAA